MLLFQEQARLHAALAALRILARKYEFKDEDERAPLASIVDATFPLLLPIFQVPSVELDYAPFVLMEIPNPNCRAPKQAFSAARQVHACTPTSVGIHGLARQATSA